MTAPAFVAHLAPCGICQQETARGAIAEAERSVDIGIDVARETVAVLLAEIGHLRADLDMVRAVPVSGGSDTDSVSRDTESVRTRLEQGVRRVAAYCLRQRTFWAHSDQELLDQAPGCTCRPDHLEVGGYDPGCPLHDPELRP